jgi:RHS repeat-associated protein
MSNHGWSARAMADTTSNESSPELADIPALQSFQFEGDPLGQIKKSVNLFRGDVNLPLELASLEADVGLSVAVTAIYDGSTCHRVDVWNRDAPTGILGLGWSLPIEQVVASRSGAASDALTRYYLHAGGSASEMVPVGTDSDGSLLFQLQAYQFWRIRYYEQQQRWEVTKEDGTTSIYGGSTTAGSSDGNSVQWGVALGNWMMASAETAGQTQIPVAWNLRRVVSTQGLSVLYAYDAVTEAVGSNGRSYTKACYLSSITDSTNRRITLLYAEKSYQPGQICEYQDPHKQTPNNNPDGYQSCYQTRYLDRISVTAGDGSLLSSVQFSYSFFSAASGSNPAHPYLFKRILTAVHLRNANDEPLPGMVFDYNPPGAVAQGMLKSVHYPQGAISTYGYTRLSLPSAREARINNPFAGTTPGVPRVWHGPDYTVITWVDTVGNRIQVSVYSWSGSWVNWTPASLQNAKVDLDTLQVATGDTFFAVFYRDTLTSQAMLLLYRRDHTQFGTWTQTVQSRPMASGTARATFAVSDDFIIVASPLLTGGAFFGAWWDWRRRAWATPQLPTVPLAAPARVAVAGLANAYVVCSYNAANKTGVFQLISLSRGQWSTRGWNATMDVLQSGDDFPLTWSTLSSGAVATYLTTLTSSSATGRMLTFQWDANFNPISPTSPVTRDLTTPVMNGTMVVNLLATTSVGATVGNGTSLSRFVGGSVANWATHALDNTQISSAATYSFAYGPEAGVMMKSQGGVSTATFSAFNPNVPNAAGWTQNINVSRASAATVGEGLATLGSDIYQEQTNGSWIRTGTLLAAQGRSVDPASVQNRAPDYIAYQDTAGANTLTYVALLQNGVVQPAITLAPDAQRLVVPNGRAGTDLAGALAFVTYPAASDFNAAPYLTLYRVVNQAVTGPVTDAPVTSISVTNGFDDAVTPTLRQAYLYATAGMTLDTVSGLAQFPMVSMLGGTDNPSGDTPYGRTDYYFSNGLASSAQQFYSAGWVWNYAGILNGSLLATVTRDAVGNTQSTNVTWFQIFNSTPDMPNLYGAYARPVRTTATRDGVQAVVDAQYDAASGLATILTTSSYLGSPAERHYRQTTTYAYQVPEYASSMRAAWALSLVAQVVVESDSAPVSSKVTTYHNWSTTGDWRWAAQGSYTWLGTNTPRFDFGSGKANPDWSLDKKVVTRTATGRIAASADAMGLVTSYTFDTTGHFQVAGFTNADTTANQAGYAGFEAYDPTDGWTMGGGAAIVTGDAHSGEAALQIPPGATGLSRSFVAAAGDMLLVAWVKTPANFGRDGGTAQWEIDVAGSTTTVAINDTATVWAPLVHRIPVPSSQTNPAVTVRCVNGKSTASFLLDDVRVGPFVGGFSARTLDIARRLVTARLDGALVTRKFVYDTYNGQLATLGPGAAAAGVQQFTTDALSRETQATDAFNPAQPNAKTTISILGTSAYLDLAAGVPLASQYTATPSERWSTSGRTVTYTGGVAGSLTASNTALAPPCVFRFSVQTAAALQNPFAASLVASGTATAAVTFDPATGAYTLTIGGTVRGTKSTPILALPATAATGLNQGQVSADIVAAFVARGWPLTPSARVTVRNAGTSWTIADAGKAYYLTAIQGGIGVAVLAREWMLVVGTRSLLFFADGIQVFGVVTNATLIGLPTITLTDAAVLSNLMIATRPLTGVSYADGTGRKVQSQSVHDDTAIVQQTLFDGVNNQIAQTKAAALSGTGRMLLGYAADFVTSFDRATGVMQGLVAGAYPECEGFPYSGRRFEASPLARLLETGPPGKAFAIDLSVPVAQRHTTRYEYAGNGSDSGLPPNQYMTTTTISPRGNRSTAFVDKTAQVAIGKRITAGSSALQTFYAYDAAGNVSTVNSPNYYAPPAGSSANDWVMRFTYDNWAHILSQTTPNEGVTQFVYDPTGRLRFTCDAEGLAKGYIVYTKYDALGRPIETGTFSAPFDRATLQAKANTDPNWPPNGAWHKRTWWDGDGSVPTTIGQLAMCETATLAPGATDVTERFTYDISGRVLTKASNVAGQEFTFAYAYDASGNVVAITYPSDSGIGVVSYTVDDLSRLIGVGTAADPLAYSSYSYGADGNLDTETFQPGSRLPIQRVIGHNPPGWISGISAKPVGGGAIFDETVTYTSGGWPDGQGWYNGSIARLDFSYADIEGTYSYRLNYDDQSQIVAAKDTNDEHYDYGIAAPVVYDPNGNIRGTSVGSTLLDYRYVTGGGDRLQTVTSSDPALSRGYVYDANGNITGVTGGRVLTIAYDQTTSLPSSIQTQTGTIQFAYDGSGRRVAKRSDTAPKVYGYGTNQQPLVEWIGTAKTPTAFIHGPAGLSVVVRSGVVNYVFRDHQRSPRVLCGTDGTIAASFDYLPFGTVARSHGDATLIDRRFTGQEFDPETGLYNYKSRLYDADIGRFLAPDPSHQFFSPYIYAANNPLSFVDPTGNFAIIAALVEGLIDLIGLGVASAETAEVATATTTTVATIAEGTEAVATGTGAASVGAESASGVSAVAATTAAESTGGIVATSSEATTTSLAEASTLATEGTEVETSTFSSLEAEAPSLPPKYYSPSDLLGLNDVGGETQPSYVNWQRWPLTYLNNTRFRLFNAVVVNNDAPGTLGYADTAAHEGFHAAVFEYAPFITWIQSLPGNIGAPLLWAEETLAYSVGHIAAGRIWLVPFTPLEAFMSMEADQTAVTLAQFAIAGGIKPVIKLTEKPLA